MSGDWLVHEEGTRSKCCTYSLKYLSVEMAKREMTGYKYLAHILSSIASLFSWVTSRNGLESVVNPVLTQVLWGAIRENTTDDKGTW